MQVICLENVTCCHTGAEVADKIFFQITVHIHRASGVWCPDQQNTAREKEFKAFCFSSTL